MRIFYAFLVMLCASLLFFLVPFTAGPYAFKTDLREDTFTVSTGVGESEATVQLFKEVYDDDVSTIDISSNDVDDVPLYSSYNTTTRALTVAGLAVSTDRTLTITYDVDALPNMPAIATMLDYTPFWLYLICIMFMGAAIALIILEAIKRWHSR